MQKEMIGCSTCDCEQYIVVRIPISDPYVSIQTDLLKTCLIEKVLTISMLPYSNRQFRSIGNCHCQIVNCSVLMLSGNHCDRLESLHPVGICLRIYTHCLDVGELGAATTSSVYFLTSARKCNSAFIYITAASQMFSAESQWPNW